MDWTLLPAMSAAAWPYLLAPDKDSRAAFRKFMAAAPEQWDWHAAGVPSALTDEAEAAQAAKKVKGLVSGAAAEGVENLVVRSSYQ